MSERAKKALIHYTVAFFRHPPIPESLQIRMSQGEILKAMLDTGCLNIPFCIGTEISLKQFFHENADKVTQTVKWSRDYINGMDPGLKMEIFSQKLLQQRGYKKFMKKNPQLELVDVKDMSSSRWMRLKSVYKLTFRERATGGIKSYYVKTQAEISPSSRRKRVNEEFYSRYLKIFNRDRVWIRMYDDLLFVEEVEGMLSNGLARGNKIKDKFIQYEDALIKWFAEEAALADAVSKGDRDIGFQSDIWGNYIFIFDPRSSSIKRSVSIDHEFVFNPIDDFTVESADKGYLELHFLTALHGASDPAAKEEKLNKFIGHYTNMMNTIREKKEEIISLIRIYKSVYGENEIAILERNLNRNEDKWLRMLYERVEKWGNKKKEEWFRILLGSSPLIVFSPEMHQKKESVRMPDRMLHDVLDYTHRYFKTHPMPYPGFTVSPSMTLQALLESSVVNLPFAFGDIKKMDNVAERELLISDVVRWSRGYVNGMPQDIKMVIFEQKLMKQKGYAQFLNEHHGLVLKNVTDLSSGRWTRGQSVYRLDFIRRSTGEAVPYIVKTRNPDDTGAERKFQNEVFYGQYLDLLKDCPIEFKYHFGMLFVEFFYGKVSGGAIVDSKLDPKLQPYSTKMVEWFAREAAIADAVSKGDRDIGMEGCIWGNFVFSGHGNIAAIDHEFLFIGPAMMERTAQKNYLEARFLSILNEYGDSRQREQLFSLFISTYMEMKKRVQRDQWRIEELILSKKIYGKKEVDSLRERLDSNSEKWLGHVFDLMIERNDPR